MKTIRFKPETTINCHVWDGEKWNAEPRQAMLFRQTDFPNLKFYITYSPTHDFGYRLTEFSTGMTIAGNYPEPTANKAAKWYNERLKYYGRDKILKARQDSLDRFGELNHSTN